MRQLSLHTICDGMMRVRANASDLIEEAKLLRQSGKISRAYALAYMACEEAGKLPILVGAATRVVIGIAVDWVAVRRRIHSHASKASQFFALAQIFPVIQQAAATNQKTLDVNELMTKALEGVFGGPALFTKRNASIYCDFAKGSFTSPTEQITEVMADRMIVLADTNLFASNLVLGSSIDETAKKITEMASRERYEKLMSLVVDTVETMLDKPEK